MDHLWRAGSGWRSRWPAHDCALEAPTWARRRCWREVWPEGEVENWEDPPSQWQTVWRRHRRFPGCWRRGIGSIQHRRAAAGWWGEHRGSESSPALSSEDDRRPSATAGTQPENPNCYTQTSPCSPERVILTQEASQLPEGLRKKTEGKKLKWLVKYKKKERKKEQSNDKRTKMNTKGGCIDKRIDGWIDERPIERQTLMDYWMCG